MSTTLCHLQLNLGVAEACPGERCAFWENDGCAIEQLGLHTLDSDVSEYLLDLRARLEEVTTEEELAATRADFARRLGRDV
jgi:hypothetical protein